MTDVDPTAAPDPAVASDAPAPASEPAPALADPAAAAPTAPDPAATSDTAPPVSEPETAAGFEPTHDEAAGRPPSPGPVAEPVFDAPAVEEAEPEPGQAYIDAAGLAGELVVYRWSDPTGEKERYGLVVAVHTDVDPHRAEVLWFAGKSGPIDARELESVPRPE